MKRSIRRRLNGFESLETRRALSVNLGPLIQVSGDSPFADVTADDVGGQAGNNFLGSEVEPYIVVNPTNSLNIVGMWQQDRWSNGGARSNALAVSFDGGSTWEPRLIPGLTIAAGAEDEQGFDPRRASDPWLAFAPNGDLYAISLVVSAPNAVDDIENSAIWVHKSLDGGLTWSDPVIVAESRDAGFFHDKESMTADPFDSNFVYAVWDIAGGPTLFSRTTDGGDTWEPVKTIFQDENFSIGHQIVVTAEGTLLDVFWSDSSVKVIRSNDRGETWSDPSVISPRGIGPGINPPILVDLAINADQILATNPLRLNTLRTAGITPDVVADPANGNIYVVWTDGRFHPRHEFVAPQPRPNEFSLNVGAIAFSVSTDDGLTWSEPIQVDQTPTDIPLLNRQTFMPSVAVADDGTVAVKYYGLRNNTTDPGLLTDVYYVQCTSNCTEPGGWRNEQRLTDESFDYELAPITGRGPFVGDYHGFTNDGNDFVALFSLPHDNDPSSAFFRRIERDIPGDSNGDGVFDSSDLVLVFSAGEYEDEVANNSTFAEGDWNGDGEFDSSDLVFAFSFGAYQI